MTHITTHILDTSLGRPAANVPVLLEFQTTTGAWTESARASTDADGRCKDLSAAISLQAGIYRLTFDTAAYFAARKIESLYPQVIIVFEIKNAHEHYHIPLLLSPYGYSTYRGS
jgi:5-hydroxyisourate hydrolase